MARTIRDDFAAGAASTPKPSPPATDKLCWSGTITAIQPRAWVWRYKTDNRNHTHTGYNLWVAGADGKLSVAISAIQQAKLGFRIGDHAAGTGWAVQGNKREIADLYRAGDLTVVSRAPQIAEAQGPPFTGPVLVPEVYKQRGCRMLDATLWRTTCMTCRWACKSRVEIEVVWGKSKRYRSETFCYGPKSCPLYQMGEPREVTSRAPWRNEVERYYDEGGLDSCLTSGRGEDE